VRGVRSLQIQRAGRRLGALLALLATAGIAAGCGADSGTPTQTSVGTAQIVTAEQVITTCYQDYFYNGVLPAQAARTNCTACVTSHLRQLGIRPPAGESVTDLLTGVRLKAAVIQTLENACTEADASEQ